MKKVLLMILAILLTLNAQALFEVKDASDHSVFEITDNGIRVFNYPDTLMIISSAEIRANLDNSKGLSRSFSVSTNATGKGTLANVLEVGTQSTTMREGGAGDQYTDFSPKNIFLGLNAGTNIGGGKYNIFIGNNSGSTTAGDEVPDMYETGYYNTFIGHDTGRLATNSYYNTYIGANSGELNTNGSDNTFVGTSTGAKNTGWSNTFIGSFSAGYDAGNGNTNVFVGSLSGSNNTTGSTNVFLGVGAGESNQTGNDNVYVGRYAGGSGTSGSGNVFLGRSAGSSETGSNRLYIDNSSTSTPLIYGDFSSNLLKFNANVGIGVAPSTLNGLYVVDDYRAIFGNTDTSTDAYTYGVYGDADGGTTRNVSIYGSSATGTGVNWAGYFFGDINVTGTVTKSADQVKIDHPLDPENKFLSYSSVVSNEMMGIYNGNAILDSEGKAIVTMPDWFESANTEFRYQLTAIGASAPGLYIATEINGNSFEIAGGKPDMKVSWQVTAIRNDKFAQKNPLKVEKDKKDYEKGYYIHPAAYGLPESRGIEEHIQEMENSLK